MMRRKSSTARAEGFAVVEAVLSALIIGLMMAAALELVAKSRSSQTMSSVRLRGHQVASMLMAEIADQPYQDPAEPTVLLGPEATELLATRAAFDDVDDYHNYTETPPKNRDGSAIPGADGWTRSVRVDYVTSADPAVDSLLNTHVKRVIVTVSVSGKKVAELVSLRTSAVNR